MFSSSHTPTQLVKLSQTEPFCILDHHHRRIRHIDSDLNDRSRYQHIDLMSRKFLHNLFFLRRFHFPVKIFDPNSGGQLFFQLFGVIGYIFSFQPFTFFYHRTDHIALTSLGDLFFHKPVSSLPITYIYHTVFDGFSVGWQLVNH